MSDKSLGSTGPAPAEPDDPPNNASDFENTDSQPDTVVESDDRDAGDNRDDVAADDADDNRDTMDDGDALGDTEGEMLIIRAADSPAAVGAQPAAADGPDVSAPEQQPVRERTDRRRLRRDRRTEDRPETTRAKAVRADGAPAPTKKPAKKPIEKPAKKPAGAPARPGGGGPGKGGPGSGNGKGKGKPPKRSSRLGRYTRRAGLIVLGLIGFGVLAFAIVYKMTPVPSSAQADAMAKGSTFYFSDGKTSFYQEGRDRRPVSLDKVPQTTRMAVIAAENRSFYADPGVSVSGTARALWSTVSGAQVQGGSTITQQMVRNYYSGLSQQRTVTRKLKEIMIALKVGNEKDKDWILEQYLNTIYFGRGAYGIQAAAHAYFDTDVSRLTPAESAYLAAAIQTPSSFAEPQSLTYAVARWHYVVDGMVKLGALSPAEAITLRFPKPVKEVETPSLRGQTGYLWQLAKQEAIARGYTEDQILRGGLKIVTTFDKGLMDAAEHAITSQLPKGTSGKVLAGLAAVNPTNGDVEAIYGGRDYLKRQYDTAAQSTAQAGSGFKPYVLAAALADGKSLDSTVDGSSPQYFNGDHVCDGDITGCTKVQNDSGESWGTVNLVTATEHSINTAYVNLGLDVGLDNVTDMAEKVGIPERQLAPNKGAPTLSLGVTAVSPLQQAAAYATFAADGMHRTPHVIKSITDSDGHIHRFSTPTTRAFSASVAHDATYAMSKVVEGGTGTNAQLPDDRPVAGKTGTTDKGRAIWFNGFVPQLATSVGIFRSDNKPLKIPGYSAYGGQLPAQMWRSFMEDATKDMPVKDFGSPTKRIQSHAGDHSTSTGPSSQPTPTTSVPGTEPSVEPPPSVEPTATPEVPVPTDEPTFPEPTRSNRPPRTKPPSDLAAGG
ncbi:MAG TPA: transglycosylase domain-containing protein [Streptosporangiaceae bacterium]